MHHGGCQQYEKHMQPVHGRLACLTTLGFFVHVMLSCGSSSLRDRNTLGGRTPASPWNEAALQCISWCPPQSPNLRNLPGIFLIIFGLPILLPRLTPSFQTQPVRNLICSGLQKKAILENDPEPISSETAPHSLSGWVPNQNDKVHCDAYGKGNAIL